MKLKRFLILVGILAMLIPWLGVPAFAEESEVEPPAEDTVVEDTVVEDDAPQNVLPAYTVNIKYTEDSSAIKGISYETYVDPVTLAVGFKIVEDLSIGHIIYDNPDTAYIDGIRINGETTDTLNIIIDQGTAYEIIIRTVYEDNLLGDVAKIIDGTFDFKTLLENPVMLLMGAYYVISILSVVFASIASLFSKSKKVKTADEIAAAVNTAAAKVDESANNAVEKVRTEVTDTVLAEVKPMLQTILDDIRNIVTALTLSTSKNKEAPLAMLDTLQKSVESTDVVGLIDGIRKTVTDGIAKNDKVRADNVETLHEIASHADTPAEEPATQPTNKSIF